MTTDAGATTSAARPRSLVLLVLGLVVVLLASCKSSDKVVADSVDGGTWVKCAMGQSYVNELSDGDPAQYGAATEAWKDYYCANEDDDALWWSRLEVYGRKYNGSTLCDTSPVASTTSRRSITVQTRAVCASGGSSHIWVVGYHGASRPGSTTIRRASSATPEVTSQ
jgi:hypothetical protein